MIILALPRCNISALNEVPYWFFFYFMEMGDRRIGKAAVACSIEAAAQWVELYHNVGKFEFLRQNRAKFCLNFWNLNIIVAPLIALFCKMRLFGWFFNTVNWSYWVLLRKVLSASLAHIVFRESFPNVSAVISLIDSNTAQPVRSSSYYLYEYVRYTCPSPTTNHQPHHHVP